MTPTAHHDVLTGPSIAKPRSRRMGMASRPSNFQQRTSTSTIGSSYSSVSSSAASPPLPARSARRPPTRTITPATPPQTDTQVQIADPMPIFRNRSFASLSDLLDALDAQNNTQDAPIEKHVRLLSDSPDTISSVDDGPASSNSSLACRMPVAPSVSKRTHALLELLSSERAYASDLALIRDIHIPLALGQPTPFHIPMPPFSSSSSGRTASTASDSSSKSPKEPPMTRDDAKTIFSNIAELAMFADMFTDRLEEALGCVVEEGQREDHVGELFLQMIPALEPPYKTYITRHPTALAHLHALPKTSALENYLSHTRELASSLSHAWDLPSLLIKPVQRLLKYSLLLGAIIDETPDSHGDKENLKLAKTMMEGVASSVNEGRRRWEVVQEVLKSKPGEGPAKIALNISATVNLSRVTSMRKYKAKEGNEEAIKVDEMKLDLKRCETFVQGFARNVVEWSKSVGAMMTQLRDWTLGFAKVIGLDENHSSEAFEAFLTVVEQQLMPLCQRLEGVTKEKLLVNLARLIDTSHSPMRLIEAMDTLEPLHFSLLNIHVSKTNRPAPALLEASQSYLALRGQLFTELPLYLRFLHKGLRACILQLSEIQTVFYADVRERWSDLWEALRVDGEMNAGAEETVRVWWDRWEEVEKLVGGLDVVNPKIYVETITRARVPPPHPPTPPPTTLSKKAKKQKSSSLKSSKSPTSPSKGLASPSKPTSSHVAKHMQSSPDLHHHPKQGNIGVVSAMLGALAPAYSSPSLPTARPIRHKPSTETFATHKSAHHDSPYIQSEEYGLYLHGQFPNQKPPTPSRSNSMPLGSGSGSGFLQSASTLDSIPPNPPTSYAAGIGAVPDRGRMSSRPGFRQKISDVLRPSSTSRRRSPSTRSFATYNRSDPFLPKDHDIPHLPVLESPSPKDWHLATAKYACRVVHPCIPPEDVSYHGLPFFELHLNHVLEILEEAGHPSMHADLPLYVDDGEDCLLLARDRTGTVGWALASFLIPVD